MEEFWFKITKWGTDKPDFCKIIDNNEKAANYKIEDMLIRRKNIVCEYFSTNGKYRRDINNIMNYEIVGYNEVQKHMDKINYAIEKQKLKI